MPRKYRYTAIWVILIVLALDIWTKYWVESNLPAMNQFSLWYPYGGIGIFRNVLGIQFSIVHAINRGAAWSLFSEYQLSLMWLRGLLSLGLFVYLFFFNKHAALVIPFSLILAGALGNMLDYFIYGHVIDMFYFSFWGYDYPIFNVADSAITIGIFWIFFMSLPEKQK